MGLLTINPETIIDRLPLELSNVLLADHELRCVAIVVADEGNVGAEVLVKQALMAGRNGKRGVAIIVLQMLGHDDQPNLQFGPMTLSPAFQIIELREENRDPKSGTGKPARTVARRVHTVIKNCGLVGIVTDLRPASPSLIPVNNHPYGANVIVYEVDFQCLEQSATDLSQVQTPVITGDNEAATIALTTTTVGATIFYSTDDSYPSSANNSAVYTDPIPFPPEGLTIRAAAELPGKLSSKVTRAFVFNNNQ